MAAEEDARSQRVRTVDPGDVDPGELFGSAIERQEDPNLLTGDAEYTDDIQEADLGHIAILRSQYAHAEIESIDTSEAEAMDGIEAVFTHNDLARDDTPGDVPFLLPVGWLLDSLEQVDHPMLADGKVRYQGEAVAVVVADERYVAHDALDAIDVEYSRLDAVADERYVAHDALDAIDVEYSRLDAVTSPAASLDSDAPTVQRETDNNQAFDWEIGDADKTAAAFDEAAETVELDLENQLLIPNAMEPRACVADYSPGTNDLEVRMTSQNPHIHRLLMSGVIGHPENKLHVSAPDVGSGFGSKIHHYPDEAIVAWTAKALERPVKWTARRTETYKTDAMGRGHETSAEIAVDDDGNVTGLRVDTKANIGAYLSTFSPSVPTYLYGTLLSGQYDIPAIHCSVQGAFTNVPPVDAYRGAGRPEAAFVIERMMTLAARELDMDPAEFRRQNYIDNDNFPFESQVAVVYDSGDYEGTLDKALDALDYDDFRQRQAEAREEGKYLGVGLSCYIEACGLAPSELVGELGAQAGLWESSIVRMTPSGTVNAYVGTSGHGQGHDTTYSQILADELGVPYDSIEIYEGDTDEIPQGMGTYGSRSAVVGGASLAESAHKVIDKARSIAAHQLEAPEDDIEFEDGEFFVSGAPDRSMTLQEVSGAAYLAHDIPEGLEPGLEATTFFDPDNFVFPFGTHAAVVEVDPDSGEVEIDQYVAVDDVGPQINPKIVEGQIHGGVAQGIGQALYEGAEFDDNGNLLTGSMQDYAVPKATHVPSMELDHQVTESPHNPLGVKGVGEAGTIAAAQAVVNAVTDALQPFDVDHIEMPLTNERVWRAINENGGDH